MAAFADLRRRLTATSNRARVGDCAAVATMADADRAIRALREARADDCAAPAGVVEERPERGGGRAAGRTEDDAEAPDRAADETDDGADGETDATAAGDGPGGAAETGGREARGDGTRRVHRRRVALRRRRERERPGRRGETGQRSRPTGRRETTRAGYQPTGSRRQTTPEDDERG